MHVHMALAMAIANSWFHEIASRKGGNHVAHDQFLQSRPLDLFASQALCKKESPHIRRETKRNDFQVLQEETKSISRGFPAYATPCKGFLALLSCRAMYILTVCCSFFVFQCTCISSHKFPEVGQVTNARHGWVQLASHLLGMHLTWQSYKKLCVYTCSISALPGRIELVMQSDKQSKH